MSSVSNNSVAIANVINAFATLKFDDAAGENGLVTYKTNMYKNHAPPSDANVDEMRATVFAEFVTFAEAIKRHHAREIVALPETFDHKYGHWHVFQWIVGRWFRGLGPDDMHMVPLWYKNLIAIANKRDIGRQCLDVVGQCVASMIVTM